MNAENYDESDPLHHVAKIQQMLEAVANHCREDIAKVTEPRAQALFETSAEVLLGLKTAYEHYAAGEELGMRR
ncbi:MAG: hypothetical protein ABI162_00435 [Luteolibacter sp.]